MLSKLKDRVDIENTNSTETIKTLVHLPKAWTNEAIEKRANESTEKKRKQKRPADNIEGNRVSNNESAKKHKLAGDNGQGSSEKNFEAKVRNNTSEKNGDGK